MNIELEKFITDLDEHLKKKQKELNENADHVKIICKGLGYCRVRLNTVYVIDSKQVPIEGELEYFVDVAMLEEEMKNILAGARADIIYEYQEFVRQFVEEAETGEEDEE